MKGVLLIKQNETLSARAVWRAEMKKLAAKGDYASALALMAQNWRDRGDIVSLIENFAENADPWLEGGTNV